MKENKIDFDTEAPKEQIEAAKRDKERKKKKKEGDGEQGKIGEIICRTALKEESYTI